MAEYRVRLRVQAVAPEATNAEIQTLARLSRRVDELPPKSRRRVRQLLRAAFDELKILES